METKTKEKAEARQLRLEGKSLKRIARLLGVAKSSVSVWCRDIVLTEEQKALLSKRRASQQKGAMANKRKRQNQIREIKLAAKEEMPRMTSGQLSRLKDIGTALYWAEGGKRSNNIDMTNSDPEVMRIAMLWLRIICNVPEHRFNITIHYHYNQNEEKIKCYWSKVTGVPLNQFGKSYMKKEGTGHRKRNLYRGTCKVRVYDSDLLHRVMGWIEQLHLPNTK